MNDIFCNNCEHVDNDGLCSKYRVAIPVNIECRFMRCLPCLASEDPQVNETHTTQAQHF